MSNIKRTFDQLGIPGLSHSNKRPKSPQPAVQNLRDPGGSSLPPNIASSSTEGLSTQPPTSSTTRGIPQATGRAILSTLKGSMKLLRKGCGGFMPLESAAETLLGVLDAIETTAHGNQSDALHNLASDLPQWAIVLSTYVSTQNPEGMSRGIERLSETLREQAEYISRQHQSGKFSRLLVAEKELEELQGCYRHIESAFQQLQTDSNLNTWRITDTQLKDSQLNGLNPAHDARYDSSFSDTIERGRCFENTRVTVLDEARHWMYNSNGAKVYWMNGMAGTGKTTIAFSVCAELKKNGLLGASFFCSRASPECSTVSRILPTIAYQLAQHSYPFRCALCRALSEEPNLGQRSISVQFESLIGLPLLEVKDVLPDRLVVVIDALDECSDPKTTETMLNILLEHTTHLPIRFFLTSRPEPSVSTPVLSKSETFRSILYLHDVDKSLVQDDIETYLTVTLASLALPIGQIKQLAEQAGILFIYAATVSKYILAGNHRNSALARLGAVLSADTTRGSKKDREIDRLYKTILAAAMDDGKLEDYEMEMIQQVLWTVVCAKEPMTTTALAELLAVHIDQVMAALEPLRSVVNITQDNSTVSTLHASFPDFLLTLERSSEFHCEPRGHSSYLAAQCFRCMERSLRFNICNLESSFWLDQEVPDLDRQVDQSITSGLAYACRYWSDHLASGWLSAEFLSLLDLFLKHRLLFWMEVLSLKKWSSHAEAILGKAVDHLSIYNNHIELRDFAYDARNFATAFAANPCSLSTPHIYISVLPFTSRDSRIWKTYGPRTQGLIQLEGAAIDGRGKSALATWTAEDSVRSIALSNDGRHVVSGLGWGYSAGSVYVWDTSSGIRTLELSDVHRGGVTSVALSPDNARIVSGSYDFTICIWDAIKGERIAGPLRGHTSNVTSVAFSIDGARLASGSDDSMLRMWDAYSGAPLGEPLEGHRKAVSSVVFSPNGRDLASSSHDRTIRVWDVQAGTVTCRTIEGHTNAIYSIAYSRDGLRLASGSQDCTVRVWNVSDGTLLTSPFDGHTDAVTSVGFSPDGARVVSGSRDYTIRVWETVSGTLLAGPFEGHGGITSVLFTANGTRIISSSLDQTIRVWDARQGSTGATKPSGHTDGINSIALSPDGARVASGSDDKTIRVWDTHSGALVAGPFTGHTDAINSVVFSPDGARIVSGSLDCTLHTWDASTGALLVGPIEGHTSDVKSIAFSPDGSQIASGSWDCTIRLWDSHTGASVAEPLTSHILTVTSIAFSSNGARLVSGSYDDTVRMWDATNGTPLWTSHAHTNWVRCVAFSPDGTRVVSGSNDGTILVLDAGDGAVLHGPFTGHTHWVLSVGFSPDGTRVVSGSRDKTVRVWDVKSGTMVAGPLKSHTDMVKSVAFSPDGARIVSGSADHTIRIWDVAAAAEASATSRDDWSIGDDGWLTDSNSQRLFWVPADLRRGFGLLTPSNSIAINADCTTHIDNTTLSGDRWHECYDASSVSAPD